MKKGIALALAAITAVSLFAGCGAKNQDAAGFDTTKEIGVVSREDGSGTRGAFIELFGVEVKNDAGEKMDETTQTAVITNSTSVMMTTIAGDPYAIGYISLGSLNDTIKPMQIDGVDATAENIANGTYKISRPFNVVTMGTLSENAQDFMDYILSADGQKVVSDSGYIPLSTDTAYAGKMDSGKVVVAGSSSVTPVMEKLKEAYIALNPGVNIEVQQSDSSTGVTSTIEGICDIGMASRGIKDSELEKGVTGTVIATDGIAVIANKENTVNSLSAEQVRSIFTGESTTWDQVAG